MSSRRTPCRRWSSRQWPSRQRSSRRGRAGGRAGGRRRLATGERGDTRVEQRDDGDGRPGEDDGGRQSAHEGSHGQIPNLSTWTAVLGTPAARRPFSTARSIERGPHTYTSRSRRSGTSDSSTCAANGSPSANQDRGPASTCNVPWRSATSRSSSRGGRRPRAGAPAPRRRAAGTPGSPRAAPASARCRHHRRRAAPCDRTTPRRSWSRRGPRGRPACRSRAAA